MTRSRFHSLEFILGAGITLVICTAVLTSGWLFPDVGKIDLTPGGCCHPSNRRRISFCTDPLGRDVLARVVVGARSH